MDETDRESARLDFLMEQKLRRQKALLEEDEDEGFFVKPRN